MAASEDELAGLHTQVAKALKIALEGTELPEEVDTETGEILNPATVIPPSAAVLTAAMKFLKDNNITCAPSKDNAVGELERAMQEREEKRAARKAALAPKPADFLEGLHS